MRIQSSINHQSMDQILCAYLTSHNYGIRYIRYTVYTVYGIYGIRYREHVRYRIPYRRLGKAVPLELV